MPVITTDKAGLNTSASDPKPVRQFNWLGQPMEDGDNYWGNDRNAPQTRSEASITRPDPAPLPRHQKRTKHVTAWTTERRQAMSDKIKDLWRTRRSAKDKQSVVPPSVDQAG